jgi:hypothetical protein
MIHRILSRFCLIFLVIGYGEFIVWERAINLSFGYFLLITIPFWLIFWAIVTWLIWSERKEKK